MYSMQSLFALGAATAGASPPVRPKEEAVARTTKRVPMGKAERQRLIQTVVQQRDIATQRELVHSLSALGCDVTQATVSRDIRELDLHKVRPHLGRAK